MQFRREAIANIEQELDSSVTPRFVRPPGLAILSVLVAIISSGIAWLFFGTVPSQLHASGRLGYETGLHRINAPESGVVESVDVKQGATLSEGAVLLHIRVNSKVKPIAVRMPDAGSVLDIVAEPGQFVSAGTLVAHVGTWKTSPSLLAILYVPQTSAYQLHPGLPVEVSVSTAQESRFGFVHGLVAEVEEAPQSAEMISAFLDDERAGLTFAAGEEPLKVTIRLKSEATKSGFSWSKSKGPEYQLAARTTVSAAIKLPAARPVDRIF